MYAIINDGGKQLTVREGQELAIDYRVNKPGETLTFDCVLACSDGNALTVGQPQVASASVTAEVVGPMQGPKLTVQKFRRRKNSRRLNGHRQLYTKVRISSIAMG